MSWVDLLLIVFILLGLWQGFLQGFMLLLFHLGSLVLAILVTLWVLPITGDWLESQIKVPVSYARPIALTIIFIITATFFNIIGNILHKLFAPILHANPANRALGAALGGFRQALIAGIVLTLLVSLPVPQPLKDQINNGVLSRSLIQATLRLEQIFEKKVDKETLDAVTFHAVGEGQSTTTALNYTVEDPKTDEAGELAMFTLTNETRKKAGAPSLEFNATLRDVARAHARDMLVRGYFSHFSPESEDVAKRVQKTGLTVTAVGENLANAPTIVLTQTGLLASEGHRKNILSKEFNQVGIGVMDAGSHGKMVVEVFARTY